MIGTWKMTFRQDAVYDVVEAKFEGVVLHTAGDVFRWRDEVERYLSAFGRKVDLLIDLEGLDVRPTASRMFGEVRAMVLAKHTLRSFRYNGNPQTRTSVFTTSVLNDTAANVYSSRAEALAAMLAERRGRREAGRS